METSDEIRKRVGQNIRKRRQEMGMSQEELAFAIGKKSRSAVSKIELGVTGSNPVRAILRKGRF